MTNKFIPSNKAVTPVISTILIVAIVIILSATFGAYILGFGTELSDTAPQTQFEYTIEENKSVWDGFDSYQTDVLTITHNGGDNINSENLIIKTKDTRFRYISDNTLKAFVTQDEIESAFNNPDINNTEYAVEEIYQSNATFKEMNSSKTISSGNRIQIATVINDVEYYDEFDKRLKNSEILVIYKTSNKEYIISSWNK